MLAKFNAGDSVGAADQFLVWDKAHVGGKVVALAGLDDRRRAERALFLTADTKAGTLKNTPLTVSTKT